MQGIAGEVRAWMARRRRSSRSVAAQLGCTEPYLSRRLTGAVPFNAAELATIAELLEVPVSEFFEVPEGVRRGRIRALGLAA